MKLRLGFVANSSTTSFVMYGLKVRDEILLTDNDDNDNPIDYYELAEEVGLSLHYPEDGWYYIGKDITSVSNDADLPITSIMDSYDQDMLKVETRIKINTFLDNIDYKENREFGIFAGSYLS